MVPIVVEKKGKQSFSCYVLFFFLCCIIISTLLWRFVQIKMVINKPFNQFLYRLQPSSDLGRGRGSGCGSVCVLSVNRTVVEEKVCFETCSSHYIGCAVLSLETVTVQLLNTSFSFKLCFRKKGVHMKKCCLDTGRPWMQSLIFYA